MTFAGRKLGLHGSARIALWFGGMGWDGIYGNMEIWINMLGTGQWLA